VQDFLRGKPIQLLTFNSLNSRPFQPKDLRRMLYIDYNYHPRVREESHLSGVSSLMEDGVLGHV
jgi:hypothetical protein